MDLQFDLIFYHLFLVFIGTAPTFPDLLDSPMQGNCSFLKTNFFGVLHFGGGDGLFFNAEEFYCPVDVDEIPEDIYTDPIVESMMEGRSLKTVQFLFS